MVILMILRSICPLYEMMILRSVCQHYDKKDTWRKERMKDTTTIAKNRKKGKHLYGPLTYKEITGYITKEASNANDNQWQLQEVLCVHYTSPNHKDRLESEYNVMILWNTGEVTVEPLISLPQHVKVLFENGEVTSEPLPFLAKDVFPSFCMKHIWTIFSTTILPVSIATSKSFMMITMNKLSMGSCKSLKGLCSTSVTQPFYICFLYIIFRI